MPFTTVLSPEECWPTRAMQDQDMRSGMHARTRNNHLGYRLIIFSIRLSEKQNFLQKLKHNMGCDQSVPVQKHGATSGYHKTHYSSSGPIVHKTRPTRRQQHAAANNYGGYYADTTTSSSCNYGGGGDCGGGGGGGGGDCGGGGCD